MDGQFFVVSVWLLSQADGPLKKPNRKEKSQIEEHCPVHFVPSHNFHSVQLTLCAQQNCLGSKLKAGQHLTSGSCLLSANGSFELLLQSDGNLVLYNLGTNAAEWSSGTGGKSIANASLMGDGRLGLTDASGKTIWASHAAGENARYSLAIKNDGNIVIYKTVQDDSDTVLSRSVWSSVVDVHIAFINGQLGPSKDVVTLIKKSGQTIRWYNDTSENITINFDNGSPFSGGQNPFSIKAGGQKGSGTIQAAPGTSWSYTISTPAIVIDP
jgi:hypothetical protein